MLWVIVAIVTIFLFLAIEGAYRTWNEGLVFFCGGVSVFGYFTCIFAFCALLLGSDFTIDKKLVMYQEENVKIEEQMAIMVSNYMEYEKGIVYDCAPGEAMTLVTLYPDLASRQLVSVQMDVYIDNNKKIKELKSKQLLTDLACWWLYFG